jgi:2-hydroxy-3-oxopropionate reductase
MDAAKALELYLPHSASLQQLMNKALADGLSDKDHAALYQVLSRD